MKNNECCEKKECTPQYILSQESTNEILGEDLCFLIAIGKNGKPVRFFPYGTELQSNNFQPDDETTESILEISIKIPKEEHILSLAAISPRCIPVRALCRCKVDGEWENC